MNIKETKRKINDKKCDFLRKDKRLNKNIILLTIGGSYAMEINRGGY